MITQGIRRALAGEAVSLTAEVRGGTFDAWYQPLVEPEGQVRGVVGVVHDVTERKQTEYELWASKEHFKDLYENAPVAYFSVSMNGCIYMINQSAEQLLGYSRDNLIGRSVIELYADTPAGKEKEQGLNQQIQLGEEVHGTELEMCRSDGSLIWVDLTVRLVRDTKGQPIGRRATVVDITERRDAERALQDSEELYRTLVNNSVLGLSIYAPGEKLLFGNQRLTEIVGYTQEEYESPEFSFLDLFLAEDQDLIVENTKRRLSGENIPPYEVQLIAKDKTLKWVEVHNVFVKYRGRDAIQVQLLDVTERKRAEEARRRNRELEALFKTASILSQPVSLSEKASPVLAEVIRVVQADGATLRVLDPGSKGLRLVARVGDSTRTTDSVISAEGSISGTVL